MESWSFKTFNWLQAKWIISHLVAVAVAAVAKGIFFFPRSLRVWITGAIRLIFIAIKHEIAINENVGIRFVIGERKKNGEVSLNQKTSHKKLETVFTLKSNKMYENQYKSSNGEDSLKIRYPHDSVWDIHRCYHLYFIVGKKITLKQPQNGIRKW